MGVSAVVALVLLGGCARGVPPLAAVPDAPRGTLHELDPAQLMGEWFVVRTTLDFWDNRTDPVLQYAPLPPAEDGSRRWSDTVRFVKNGREKVVRGVDTQSATRAGHFQWQGRGLLAVMTSQCSIVAMDPDGNWAVSWFSATAATPAGMDILARRSDPPAQWIHAAEQAIADQPELARWWGAARATVHTRRSPVASSGGPGSP